jgi:uncharacterized protein
MFKRGTDLVFSPSDLITFFESPFASFMDRLALEHPDQVELEEPDAEAALVTQKGNEHEARYLARCQAAFARVYIIERTGEGAFAETLAAMAAGERVIYQGALRHGPFAGFADFLFRVDKPARDWGWSYTVADTKLAKQPKPYFLLQLCAYAEMLEAVQGIRPETVQVISGTDESISFRTSDYYDYYRTVKAAFLAAQERFDRHARPMPDPRANHRRFRRAAAAILEQQDHLCRVAGITKAQTQRLEDAGITTCAALAQSQLEQVPRLDPNVYRRLRAQAQLQRSARAGEPPPWQLSAHEPGTRRGLALLPPPSALDVYFDMEGYPFAEGGLEYLFGAVTLAHGQPVFTDYWAHDEASERLAFQRFMDWVIERFRRDRTLHIYHYAPYEVTALRRLMGKYGTREEEVDMLLRAEAFVDLYTVVRQSLRVGEPSYSLKNIEHLYRPPRAGDVGTAGESVVEYARWLQAPDGKTHEDSQILRGIRAYNREDCESTWQLCEWLRVRQSEAGIAFERRRLEAETAALRTPDRAQEALAQQLYATIPADRSVETVGAAEAERWRIHELLAHLLCFHRREHKPTWWALFERQQRTEDELLADPACLAGLALAGPPTPEKQSLLYTYGYPPQETKLDVGDECYVAADRERRLRPTVHSMDLAACRVTLKLGSRHRLPDRLSLLPNEYVPPKVIEESILRTAQAYARTGRLPGALADLLGRRPPRLEGKPASAPVLRPGLTTRDGAIHAVLRLDASTLAIQGPPGAGKTHTAAHMILALLDAEKRVAITSNGHTAIWKLLAEVLAEGRKLGRAVRALKVGPDDAGAPLVLDGRVEHVATIADADLSPSGAPLVGGTAWAFSNEAAIGRFDYLFVDEASQVSLANLVGMAPCAANLVLLGDPAQLPQPLQGKHPGESGTSALEYFLHGHATIPPELGIFLGTTHRMHPAVCEFVSDAFYEGRLTPEDFTSNRVIRTDPRARAIMREAGLVFVPTPHEGNGQESDEEAAVIVELVGELLGRALTDRDGAVRGSLGPDDILIVAPYNLQVRNLKLRLPNVRVGTVDKFQGQEAPVVIVSMCTSEGECDARGLEFLLSPNRLNVALSRAQSLAVVVGNPGLFGGAVTSVPRMKLANLYCRLVDFI